MHATVIDYAPHIVGSLRTVSNTTYYGSYNYNTLYHFHINLVQVVKLHSTYFNKMFLTDRRLTA